MDNFDANNMTVRITTCPFCNKVHTTRPWLNVICPCGAKFYINTKEWLNRKTGERRKHDPTKC